MPHFSAHGKLMSKRSNAEIVWVFLVMPPLLATIILAVVFGMAVRAGTAALQENLFGLVWCAIVLPAVAIGLPGVGWRELRQRKRLAELKDPVIKSAQE